MPQVDLRKLLCRPVGFKGQGYPYEDPNLANQNYRYVTGSWREAPFIVNLMNIRDSEVTTVDSSSMYI